MAASLHARPLRLAVQDVALSRRKHGFESRRGHQILGRSRSRRGRRNDLSPVAVVASMALRPVVLLLFLAGCSMGPEADLQYIKQARSLAAEWALVNEQSNAGRLTPAYVRSMHRWLHDDLAS